MSEDSIFLLEPPKPEIFWSHLKYPKTYNLLIRDILSVKSSSNKAGGRKYLVFDCWLLKGFESVGVVEKTLCELYIPEASFKIAWNIKGMQVPENKMYDCLLTIVRETKKKMYFTNYKFMETGKYDRDEIIKGFGV